MVFGADAFRDLHGDLGLFLRKDTGEEHRVLHTGSCGDHACGREGKIKFLRFVPGGLTTHSGYFRTSAYRREKSSLQPSGCRDSSLENCRDAIHKPVGWIHETKSQGNEPDGMISDQPRPRPFIRTACAIILVTFLESKNLQSSNLRSVRYDAVKKNLEIEFRSGIIHQYQNVPSAVHTGLLNASSAGIFYTENIKNRFRNVSIERPAIR